MKLLLFVSLLIVPVTGFTKLKVLTTTTNLRSITQLISGGLAKVESLTKGTQDPHFIEAKPSFMVKASRSDLLISVGFYLEVGWLPLIIRGARNPKLRVGNKARLVAGNFITPLEKPIGPITRADGDIHPQGNPHFLLDPTNAVLVAKAIKDKLSALDSKNAIQYEENFKALKKKLEGLVPGWKKKIKSGLKVITYHRTLSYFYKRFKINNTNYLEPKPGVPPTASHILAVIKQAQKDKVRLIIIENYFDPSVAKRVAAEVEEVTIRTIPVAVDGDKNSKSIFDLYENIIQAMVN